MSNRIRSLARWLSHRAWSRAGAVAEVIATGPTRRVLAASTRLVLLLAGSVLIGVGVAAMIWDGLGPGPLDVFIVAVRERTGLPFAPAMWLTIGAMALVARLLGRRPGIGTLLAPLVIGPVVQVTTEILERFQAPDSTIAGVMIHIPSIGAIGVGAGALIVSGLGAGSGELLAAAASDRSGQAEPHVRLAIESSLVVLGVALGGPAGLGTVLMAVGIGPAVAGGYRVVDATVIRVRRRVAATRATIVALAG